MHVLRGRDRTPAADRKRSQALLERVREQGEPALRVWRPHPQVAFGRRDANEPGYESAKDAARRQGFAPVERDVGGRAVAYTGSTIAFARFEPIEDPRRGLEDRYERMTADVETALAEVGVETSRGEPAATFCPGQHSLQNDGKIVGIAQRVTAEAAVVSGVLVVDQHDRIGRVLAPVYDALGLQFDPSTVGSVERAGGNVERVRDVLESTLVGSASVRAERIP